MPAHRKENPIRRNLPQKFISLPREGRKGRAPVWPLGYPKAPAGMEPIIFLGLVDDILEAEKKLWSEIWHTPQAVMWERMGYDRIVARYVRHVLEIEDRNPNARLLAEVRATEDRLGLTPMAMVRLQWQIVEDEVGEARDERADGQSRAESAKKRLVAVESAQ